LEKVFLEKQIVLQLVTEIPRLLKPKIINIKGLYFTIPLSETLNIVKTKLLQNNDIQIAEQILTLLKEVLSQNYFAFQQRIYQPEQGIAMGSPISGIIAEIF
jgi:hypothetical protein